MTFAATGNRNTALRLINAENDFLDTLVRCSGITKDEAVLALKTFRKVKAVKTDAVIGRITVKHGAFLEADVIRRAVEAAR